MAERGPSAERAERRAEAARGRRLRPARFDDLGLKRALSDRLLPSLVAAMAFLAALALAGFVAADELGARWQAGAGSSLLVQIPQPGLASGADPAATVLPAPPNRRDAVVALLERTEGAAKVHALSEGELADLLRPWLGAQGEAITLPLPAVVEVTLADQEHGPSLNIAGLDRRLQSVAPGTLVENQDAWVVRLAALARSLQASSGLALMVVVAVAIAVVAVATRSGLVARRQAIEIVHGLGATDQYIAGRFAGRATWLALLGGAIGAAAALPVLLELALLAAPFAGAPTDGATALPRPVGWIAALPAPLWIALPCLPATAAAIGWLTAQATVRRWLRRLACMRRLLRVGGGLAMVLAIGWTAGFVWFAYEASRPQSDLSIPRPELPHADGIVVLTGGGNRIEQGLRLLADGQAPLLLVSGVLPGTDLARLARGAGLDPAPIAGRVTLGQSAISTRGNAEETVDWVARHDLHTLIVVTAFYHMPRALAELRRALPGTKLYAYAVLPSVLRGGGAGGAGRTFTLLATEYTKWLLVQLGVPRYAADRRPGEGLK